MKFFIQFVSGLGVAAFFIGAVLKILGVESLFNGAPVAWWRASMFFLTVAMLYELIEIRDTLKFRVQDSDQI